MTPALGTLNPETRHLNLKWTVAEADYVLNCARRGDSVDEIAKGWIPPVTAEEVVAICSDAGVFVRTQSRRAGR